MANYLPFQKKSFFWSISNFSMCPQLPGEAICSPEFDLECSEMVRFTLDLYPKGIEKDLKEYVCISINGNVSDYAQLRDTLVRFHLKIVPNLKESNAQYLFSGYLKIKNGLCWQCLKLLKRSVLLDTEVDKLLPRDKLDLALEFSSLNTFNTVLPHNYSHLEKLSVDLEKALKTGNHYDLVLRGTGDMLIKAHKAILFCRYPNFAETLTLQEDQSLDYRFCIDSLTLQAIIKYLYSGKMEIANVPSGVYDLLDSDDLPHLRHLILPHAEIIHAVTTINVIRGVFTWKFPQFSSLSSNVKIKQLFCCDNAFKWGRLRIIFYFSENENKEQCISFSVQPICTGINVCISCKISILGSSQWKKKFYFVFKNEAEWKIPNVIQKRFLMEKKDTFLINDTLRIRLNFKISDGILSRIVFTDLLEVTAQEGNAIAKDLFSLQQDLLKLYRNPVFTDVTLCVGDKKLPAHRVILTARSPVFCKMFEHETLEKKTGQIVIEDISIPVVKTMLFYMYCGNVDKESITFDFACELYAASDKYEIPLLRKLCSSLIKKDLNVQNVGDVLNLADAHCDLDLKKSVQDFVCSNADKVMNSTEWNRIMAQRPDLATQMLNAVLAYVASKKDEVSRRVSLLLPRLLLLRHLIFLHWTEEIVFLSRPLPWKRVCFN